MTHFGIRHWNRNLLTLVALLPTAGALGAGWNEAVDGDLSGNYQSPTVINLVPGVNTIRATSASTPTFDLEYFQLNLPAQSQIDAIILREYDQGYDTTFIGVQQGAGFTFPANDAFTNIGSLLGWAHFGDDPLDLGVGDDLLPVIGTGGGAVGFSGPLTGSTYTFWAQQQSSTPTTYALEFVVSSAVPEPTTLAGVIAALLVGACGRRIRR